MIICRLVCVGVYALHDILFFCLVGFGFVVMFLPVCFYIYMSIYSHFLIQSLTAMINNRSKLILETF